MKVFSQEPFNDLEFRYGFHEFQWHNQPFKIASFFKFASECKQAFEVEFCFRAWVLQVSMYFHSYALYAMHFINNFPFFSIPFSIFLTSNSNLNQSHRRIESMLARENEVIRPKSLAKAI